jgi:hypothetical protein
MSHNAEIGEADEGLDFLDVLDKAASGQIDSARSTFAARSHWMVPGTAAVALATERLRAGAKPAQLTGALANDPETIRKTVFEQRIAALTEGKGAPNLLWSAIRAPVAASAYTALARNSWKTDKSKYMIVSKAGSGPGEVIVITNGSGVAAGEALLLHAALIAKTRDKAGFMLMPLRKRIDVASIRFGNPGDPGFPADMMLDADTVIAGIAPIIPEPPKR